MPAGRVDHFEAGAAAELALQCAQIGQRHQAITGNADQVDRNRDSGRIHCMQVDGLAQRQIAARRTAARKLAAAVLKPGFHRQLPATCDGPRRAGEALAQFAVAAIGGQRQLSRQRHRIELTPRFHAQPQDAALDGTLGGGQRMRPVCAGDGHQLADALAVPGSKRQPDHRAVGCTDKGRRLRNVQAIQQCGQCIRLIGAGDGIHAQGFGVQPVDGQHPALARVNGLAWPDQRLPPAVGAVRRTGTGIAASGDAALDNHCGAASTPEPEVAQSHPYGLCAVTGADQDRDVGALTKRFVVRR